MTRTTRVALVALVAAVAVGGLAAAIIHHAFLVKYRADIGIPIYGDVALFRQVQPTLNSAQWVQTYAQAKGLDDTEVFKRTRVQFASTRDDAVTFSHVFAVSRADMRDVPERMLEKLLANGDAVGSSIVVSAVAADPPTAINLADFTAKVGRDVLVQQKLRDEISTLATKAAQDIAEARVEQAAAHLDIASLMRRIDALQKLRDEYRNDTASLVGGVQVRVEGPRYLSPVQQLVGLESGLVDRREDLKLAEAKQERKQALVALAESIREQTENSASGLEALEVAEGLVEQRFQSASSENIKAAVAQMVRTLSDVRVRLVDTPLSPPQPTVTIQSPPRTLVILAGIVFGIAVWLLVFRGLVILRMRSWER